MIKDMKNAVKKYDQARAKMQKAYDNNKFEEYTEWQTESLEWADTMSNLIDEILDRLSMVGGENI